MGSKSEGERRGIGGGKEEEGRGKEGDGRREMNGK
jgi:hypothetical protein